MDAFRVCDDRTADHRFDTVKFIVNDLSEVDEIQFDDTKIKNALVYANQSQFFCRNHEVLVAFVATKECVREKVKQFLDFANETSPNWERRLFVSREAANEWAAQKMKSSE